MSLQKELKIEELKERIASLKAKKNALILSHYYQRPEVQDVADFVGDSLELSIKAREAKEDTIVFCGVYFMAEVAKILSPEKKVLIPHPYAGCLLADMITPRELQKKKEKHPEAAVVAYVNTYAEIKAMSDIICTSANAGKIMENVDRDEIIFVPDRNLGRFHAKRIKGKKVILWDGYCPVHQSITSESISKVKKRFKEALTIVHPECPPEVQDMADFVGSTSQLVKFAGSSDKKVFIVGTEEGTLHQMRKKYPEKTFLLPDPEPVCHQMKMITLERVVRSLEEDIFEVKLERSVMERARLPIEKMLSMR